MTAILEARERLHKVSRPVLTEELAERVNALAGQMPDSTPVAPLGAEWNGMMHFRARKSNIVEPPTKEWVEFMESLQPLERIHICTLLEHSTWRIDAQTVGDLREFAGLKGQYFGIGLRGKAFLAVAFRKTEQV